MELTGEGRTSARAGRFIGLIGWQTFIVTPASAVFSPAGMPRSAQETVQGETEQEAEEESSSCHYPGER